MHNEPRTCRRGGDIGGVHRVTFNPIEIEMSPEGRRILWPPVKSADAKAPPQECQSRLAAYAARRADDQHNTIICHAILAVLPSTVCVRQNYSLGLFQPNVQSHERTGSVPVS